MTFGIKESYRHRNAVPEGFLDLPTDVVWQPDVYTLAELLVEFAKSPLFLIDVGCGNGTKLHGIAQRHPTWRLAGIDTGPNLAMARANGLWAQWVDLNLEAPTNVGEAQGAVVVCADVIEHLLDPRPMLAWLRGAVRPRAIVLSTPERDLTYPVGDPAHEGPPANVCHVREWNTAELRTFLTDVGLPPKHHGLTRTHTGTEAMTTQVVIL